MTSLSCSATLSAAVAWFLQHHTPSRKMLKVCGSCVFHADAVAVCVFATTYKNNADSKTTEIKQHSFVNSRHLVLI